MLALKVVLLALWATYALGMASQPWSGLNTFGHLMTLSAFVAVPALYLLPTFEARRRGQPNVTAIALVNAFFGWTLVGWVLALVWAVKEPSIVQIAAPPAADEPQKRCPYCAETVLAAAIKCKHCGSELSRAAGT